MICTSVVDIIKGLNAFFKEYLLQCGGREVMGMVKRGAKLEKPAKKQIGMTIYGTTTPGCMAARHYLELNKVEVVAFTPMGLEEGHGRDGRRRHFKWRSSYMTTTS